MSYPGTRCPENVTSEAEREKWWKCHFEDQKSFLHQIHFHRMVVDECHHIRNPKGDFYESVLAIKATHRWLLSGTPIVDKPSEIYAYYRIIHKAYTGDLKTFRANFLKKRNMNAQGRLNYSMNNFILRRTNDDKLNSQRLLQLPRAKETKIVCSLTGFERDLYLAVLEKYESLILQAEAEERSVISLVLW
jgi:SNF2 family DNA or RNA helicase